MQEKSGETEYTAMRVTFDLWRLDSCIYPFKDHYSSFTRENNVGKEKNTVKDVSLCLKTVVALLRAARVENHRQKKS